MTAPSRANEPDASAVPRGCPWAHARGETLVGEEERAALSVQLRRSGLVRRITVHVCPERAGGCRRRRART